VNAWRAPRQRGEAGCFGGRWRVTVARSGRGRRGRRRKGRCIVLLAVASGGSYVRELQSSVNNKLDVGGRRRSCGHRTLKKLYNFQFDKESVYKSASHNTQDQAAAAMSLTAK